MEFIIEIISVMSEVRSWIIGPYDSYGCDAKKGVGRSFPVMLFHSLQRMKCLWSMLCPI